MKTLVVTSAMLEQRVRGWVQHLSPLLLLAARLYLASVFFKSGLTKIDDWETTLFLFEEEYSVPLLSAGVAAFLATAGELVLPVMLVLGLYSLTAAAGIFIINFVAVISLEAIAPAAELYHLVWGLLAAYIVVHGAGAISVDRLIAKWSK
ncbi:MULTISPECIES: DoxX family protein [Spongiibacter]|uniref:DoxX family protein n=1 Tax=Spongiibacter TaxID=630749 RepID=UPI00257A8159|nr:DoxX family protein [Spongiibacter sp. UBA1325]